MRRLIAIMSLTLLLFSCQKEGRTIARGDFAVTLDAELPELPVVDQVSDTETKASTQYTVRIKWAEGDRLSVINLTTGKILGGCLSANSSGTRTTFSGALNGTVNEGDVIAYFYPAQGNESEMDFTGIHVDMSDQRGVTGSVPVCVYSIVNNASADSFQDAYVSFSFAMSYIMMGLSDIPSSTQIKSVSITNVTAAFDITPNGSGTGFGLTSYTGNIKLTPESNASATGVKTVYAAIPASASMERNIILETNTSVFTASFTSAKLNNGYAYNTNVSGFLVDNVHISDDVMREYCLQHFDIDGDGKLSMVEVAGVTSFPDQNLYPIPSGVSKFPELEYFYSLKDLPSFKNRKQLQTITIPTQITEIPDEMFYGCTTLIKVILRPTVPPALGKDVFVGHAGALTLVVPDNALDDYKAAEGWREHFSLFKDESTDGDANFDIDIEDDSTMGNEDSDITV